EIKSIDQFAINLFACLYDTYQRTIQKFHPDSHIITITVPKFTTFDFNLTNDDKQFLIDLGYQRTKEYFEVTLLKNDKDKQKPSEMSILEKIRQLLNDNHIN